MTTQTGGAAFPLNTTNEDNVGAFYPHEGMTLRDYFASKAMQGICAHQDTWGLRLEEIVTKAYEIADLMVKAHA